jgi:hypothetical protein
VEPLDDLDFEDDLAVLSHNWQQMQNKTKILKINASSTEL